MIRNLSITSFFIGMIIISAATLPPHLGAPADPSSTPAIILPDWYLYWSFGLLKLGPLNPDLAILGDDKLMSDGTFGVVANVVVVGVIALILRVRLSRRTAIETTRLGPEGSSSLPT